MLFSHTGAALSTFGLFLFEPKKQKSEKNFQVLKFVKKLKIKVSAEQKVQKKMFLSQIF